MLATLAALMSDDARLLVGFHLRHSPAPTARSYPVEEFAADGAAGSVFEAVSHLSCTIKVGEVKERGGGGADCSFDAGPGS